MWLCAVRLQYVVASDAHTSACRHNHDQGATECVSGTCQFAAKVTDTLMQTKGEYLFNLTALHAYGFPCYCHLQPAVAMRLNSVVCSLDRLGPMVVSSSAASATFTIGLCDKLSPTDQGNACRSSSAYVCEDNALQRAAFEAGNLLSSPGRPSGLYGLIPHH
jgi:hypothetical protein